MGVTASRGMRIPKIASDLLRVSGRELLQGSFRFDLGLLGVGSATLTGDVVTLDEALGGGPPETNRHLLADHLVPRLVAGSGLLVLHAALFETSVGGIAITGETGRGKSTLAAALAASDRVVHGDDAAVVAPIGSQFAVSGLGDDLRLNPDSLSAFVPPSVESSPMAHYSEKRRVPLERDGAPFVPLAAVVHLSAEEAVEPILSPLRPLEAVASVLEGSFALDPADTEEAGARMERICRLVSSTPILELSYQRRYEDVGKVIDVLVAGVEAEIDQTGSPTSRAWRLR